MSEMKSADLAIVMLAMLVSGCGERRGEEAEGALRYETAVVTRSDITAELRADGTVVAPPNEYAAIECPYCVPVSRVFATVGQALSAGDVIVELSHPDVREALEAARTELREAQQALAAARREYAADVATADARLQAARASERETRAALQEAQQETPPPEDLVRRQVEYQQAYERRLRMETRLEDARERMDEALIPFRQRMAAAEAAVASARAEHSRSMISTPIDGQLIELNVGPGDQPGLVDGAMAVVANLSRLRVHVPLSRERAEQVHPGMPVTISLPAVENVTFEGEVERINTQIQPHAAGGERRRNFLAVISFENTLGQAKPEMDARVTIRQGVATDVLVIPAEAVHRDDDRRPFVYEQVGDSWERRDVVIGLSDGDFTEIRMGLEEDAVVRVDVEVVEPRGG